MSTWPIWLAMSACFLRQWVSRRPLAPTCIATPKCQGISLCDVEHPTAEGLASDVKMRSMNSLSLQYAALDRTVSVERLIKKMQVCRTARKDYHSPQVETAQPVLILGGQSGGTKYFHTNDLQPTCAGSRECMTTNRPNFSKASNRIMSRVTTSRFYDVPIRYLPMPSTSDCCDQAIDVLTTSYGLYTYR